MNEFFVGVFVGCENILLPSRLFIHYLFCKYYIINPMCVVVMAPRGGPVVGPLKNIYPHHIKKTKLLLHYKQIKNIKIFTKNIRFLNIANIK